MDRICGNGESLVRGKYLLFNNLWGAAGGSGSQCLSAGESAGEQLAWSTTWTWTGPSGSVKSYAAAVLGWHWGWPVAGSGLPIRLRDIGVARARWDYRLEKTTPGPQNVACDIWIASTADPRAEDPTEEIMIWLDREGGATPIGARHADVVIDGVVWEFWEGPHPDRGWTVHSFVRAANTSSATLNLAKFFEHLIAGGLSDASYLVGIEAGTEVFTGAGTLETTHYEVEIDPR